MTKEQILKEVVSLPPIERAQLIEDIFDSFSKKREKEIDKIWAEEAEKRMKAYDKGKINAVSSSEVFNEINKWK